MTTSRATGDVQMTIVEHLEELRDRIIVVVVALVVAMIFSFFFTDKLLDALIFLAPKDVLIATSPVEPLLVWMRVALIAGVALSMPVIIYETVRFLLPALTRQERKYLYFLVPVGSLSFITGLAFAVVAVLPVGLAFLYWFKNPIIKPHWTVDNYISLVTTLMFWVGVVFELPLVMFFLAKLGLITSPKLVKFFRYWILVAAIIAAVITPTPDPVTMMTVMIPLVMLYGVGYVLVRLAGK